MELIQENRRVILIALVALLLVCLLSVLAYNIFFAGNGDDVAEGETPTAIPTEEAGPTVVITPEEADATPTPTRVLSDAATEEPTATPTPDTTTEPSPTPSPTPTRASTQPSDLGAEPAPPQIKNLVENNGFEQGFDETGVASGWNNFRTEGAIVSFSPESSESFVLAGDHAQRISIDKAIQPDRYGGIYQTVEVVPNQVYTLSLRGQIRSPFGDVQTSSYGYRMEYVLDQSGNQSWWAIPKEAWVELPWPEQTLGASDATFSVYTTTVTATSDELTLFVRGWNKWPDQTLAEYTLDNLSLVGPVPGQEMMTETQPEPGSEEVLIDQPLPVTGSGDSASLMQDGRFWGALLVLILLASGAIYRGRWGW